MNTITTGVTISPVNMDDRKNLGIKAGDTVRVHQKIQDKGKTRIQIFEGIVLARKHGSEPGATFTVRKVASGVGVEKIFPLYSPNIDKIEIVRRSKVRRAKLYFIREKVARQIKRQMRRMSMVTMSTESEAEAAAAAEALAQAEAQKAEEEAKAAQEAAQKAEEEAAQKAETKKADEAPAEEAKEEKEETAPEATEEKAETDATEEKKESPEEAKEEKKA